MPKKVKSQKKSWAVKALLKSYEAHMASLPSDKSYDLLEELTSGVIITHLTEVSLDELKSYVRRTFIESAPPSFIIRPTLFTTEAADTSQNLMTTLWRKVFDA